MAQATPQGQVQAKPPTPPGISAASIQATQAKWRHGQQEVTLDLQRVLNPDVHSGFRNIEDAVTRLLPYHVRRFSIHPLKQPFNAANTCESVTASVIGC